MGINLIQTPNRFIRPNGKLLKPAERNDSKLRPRCVLKGFYWFCMTHSQFIAAFQTGSLVVRTRTGSVGNRSADDMVKTLVEPKKTVISSIRNRLIADGYSEEVEYDAINIEPVLIYSKSEKRVLFVKHKWALAALIPIQSNEDRSRIFSSAKEIDPAKYETTDEEGNRWLAFQLPSDEDVVLKALQKI